MRGRKDLDAAGFTGTNVCEIAYKTVKRQRGKVKRSEEKGQSAILRMGDECSVPRPWRTKAAAESSP